MHKCDLLQVETSWDWIGPKPVGSCRPCGDASSPFPTLIIGIQLRSDKKMHKYTILHSVTTYLKQYHMISEYLLH
jgi:hypothetical protein